MDDLGSGTLLDTAAFGLAHEPMPQESLAAGAALAAFSGDKLLGGPQAGLIVAGQRESIERLKRHPLARAVRADKLCLAALGATLQHYLRDEAVREIPVWRMIAAPLAGLEARARAWAGALAGAGLAASVIDGEFDGGRGQSAGRDAAHAAAGVERGVAQCGWRPSCGRTTRPLSRAWPTSAWCSTHARWWWRKKTALLDGIAQLVTSRIGLCWITTVSSTR